MQDKKDRKTEFAVQVWPMIRERLTGEEMHEIGAIWANSGLSLLEAFCTWYLQSVEHVD